MPMASSEFFLAIARAFWRDDRHPASFTVDLCLFGIRSGTMKFESVQLSEGGYTLIAESPEERAMLNVAVAALESVFPNSEDRARPTPHLILLEALRIQSIRTGSAKSAGS